MKKKLNLSLIPQNIMRPVLTIEWIVIIWYKSQTFNEMVAQLLYTYGQIRWWTTGLFTFFFFLRKKNSIRWKYSHILLKKVHSMHTMDTVFIIYMRCSYFLNMFILNTWYIWHVQIMYFNESTMPYFIYMLLHKIFLQIFLIVDMTVYYWCIMKVVTLFYTF